MPLEAFLSHCDWLAPNEGLEDSLHLRDAEDSDVFYGFAATVCPSEERRRLSALIGYGF
jgi:hypothetical protein